MNNPATLSKHKNATIEDQDMFDDSSFLAKFEDSSFHETATGQKDKDTSIMNVR